MFDRIFDFVADKCATPLGVVAVTGAYVAASAVLIDEVCKYTGVVHDAAHGGTIIQTEHAVLQLRKDIDKWQEAAEFDSAHN